MGARNDEPVAHGPQPHRAPTAETIGQRHRIDVGARIHRVAIFLQCGAQGVGPVMQADFEEACFHDVGRASGMQCDLPLKHIAG
ncbi:MAG: hypothetical protein NTV46_02100 [Verrucomicrobia bacterium]|nr:hypothetical protein [Verrucomicrobiota bacterium]